MSKNSILKAESLELSLRDDNMKIFMLTRNGERKGRLYDEEGAISLIETIRCLQKQGQYNGTFGITSEVREKIGIYTK